MKVWIVEQFGDATEGLVLDYDIYNKKPNAFRKLLREIDDENLKISNVELKKKYRTAYGHARMFQREVK